MREPWSDELGLDAKGATHPMLLAQESSIAKSIEFLLSLAHEGIQSRLHVWQLLTNVTHQDLRRSAYLLDH